MTEPLCACGHPADEHQNGGGRCTGQCVDPRYGRYGCVCPYYTKDKL